MPFEPGNVKQQRGKILTNGIWQALMADNQRAFRRGCNALAKAYESGQPWAIQLVLERFAGKAGLALPEADGTLTIIWQQSASQPIDSPAISADTASDIVEPAALPPPPQPAPTGPIQAPNDPTPQSDIEGPGGG